jgi:hypothetical protein
MDKTTINERDALPNGVDVFEADDYDWRLVP